LGEALACDNGRKKKLGEKLGENTPLTDDVVNKLKEALTD
jgi:hypothetical protein